MALSRTSLLLKAVSSLVAVEVEEYETGDRPERLFDDDQDDDGK